LQFLKKLAGRAFAWDIHIRACSEELAELPKASIHAGSVRWGLSACIYAGNTWWFWETRRGERFSENTSHGEGCTISGQGLVDELHLIDSLVVTGVYFSLTLIAGSVEPTSFFDSFQRLPGWW
jgi:hypothetical protein